MTGYDPLTECIIGCSYTVANALGHGFLEKIYENALSHELRKHGLEVVQQKSILVFYDGQPMGEFFADLCVNDCVIVEIKAIKELVDSHIAQCLNYLKATGMKTTLLINFGNPRIQVKRISL